MEGRFRSCLTPHPLYTALGNDDKERQAAYRELFRYQLDPGTVDKICAATNGNYALGSAQFQMQVSAALGRRVTLGKSGRPRKKKGPESHYSQAITSKPCFRIT
jgi:putative transposase